MGRQHQKALFASSNSPQLNQGLSFTKSMSYCHGKRQTSTPELKISIKMSIFTHLGALWNLLCSVASQFFKG